MKAKTLIKILFMCLTCVVFVFCFASCNKTDDTENTDATSAQTPDGTTADAGDVTTDGSDVTTLPDGTTAGEPNNDAPTVELGPIASGSKILVVGQSYAHYGNAVLGTGKTKLTQAERGNDKGYIYQFLKEKGVDVSVMDWAFGGHGLSDYFDGKCMIAGDCYGVDHEQYLVDKYYDYVLLCPGSGTVSALYLEDSIDYITNLFRGVNPNVKIVLIGNLGAYGYSSWKVNNPMIYGQYGKLEDKGVIIADFGGLVNGIINGKYTVPGATQSYKASSFVVKDGFHPNMLTGYLTTLITYCAITGESAVGQPYAFATDATKHTSYNVNSYVSSRYNNATDTNFPAIFNSEADMLGLQTLVDEYLADKPWREIEAPERETDFEDDSTEWGKINKSRVIFIGSSLVYRGRVVMEKSASTALEQDKRIDNGYFNQLCRLNGSRVEVTNWTLPYHTPIDFFKGKCPHCSGNVNHENYLTDRYYDYVFISPGANTTSEQNILEDFEYITNFFKEANPNVKIVCLGNLGAYGHATSKETLPGILSAYKTLEDKGVIIADFGGLIQGIIDGKYQVPGATQTYTKNTFMITSHGGYNPNLLTGYITSLMAYCVMTGESAEGKLYTFWDDKSLNRSFDTASYMTKFYSTGTTNFQQVFASKEDIRGLQKLIDQYLAEKPWRNN